MLFKGVSGELISQLAAVSVTKYFSKGKIIFQEGSPATGFYMVAEGKVKIFKSSPAGREQIIYAIGPGEPFGLTPIFHDGKFPASAGTMALSIVLFFPKEEFLRLIAAHSSLALPMLSGLSRRLCRLTEKIGTLSLKGVAGRLAEHLLYLAAEQGRTDQVVLDMPKKHLASLLGTSPETLSRIFAEMSETGLIRIDGNTVKLLDYLELEQL